MSLRPIVLIGPSGAGKSTLANSLVDRHSFELISTYTTRPRRAGDDATHKFVSDEQYDTLLKNGMFIGTLDLFGYRYALPRFSCDDATTPLLLLRAPVVETFLTLYPESLVVEVDAPYEVLRDRLKTRGDDARIDKAQLEREIISGRKVADLVIDTRENLEVCLARIEESL